VNPANLAAIAAELVIMICAPIAAAIWIRRRFAVPGAVFWIAAGFFLTNLVVNVPLVTLLWPSLFGAGSWALLAAAAMTYAVCEEIARYLSFRAGRTMRASRTADGALAAGVGHGGAESILFGLQYAWGMAVVWLLPQALPPGAAEQLSGSPWWTFLLTGVERPVAIACHVGFAALIVLAYRRSALFLPVAVAAHFVVDLATFGLQSVVGGFWHDVLFLAFAIGAVLVFRWVRRSCPRVEASDHAAGRRAVRRN
jgi:uncharacterized membrane protein YhfC